MTIAIALIFLTLPMLAGAVVRVLDPGQAWLRMLLSFSGAFLVSVVFLHMLPELYEEEGAMVGAWVLAGFLLQVVLEFFSEGIEHGHIHVHAHPGAKHHPLPWITLASLSLHAFAEGMPFADAGIAGDLPFVTGVVLHKVPMAVALATVLLRSGVPGGWSWVILGLFAISAPLGMWAGHLADGWMDGHFLQHMLGLAIGMLLHIGTTIIFESAPDHRFNAARFVAVLTGVVLAALSIH